MFLLLTIYHGIDNEWCSQSDNRALIDFYRYIACMAGREMVAAEKIEDSICFHHKNEPSSKVQIYNISSISFYPSSLFSQVKNNQLSVFAIIERFSNAFTANSKRQK